MKYKDYHQKYIMESTHGVYPIGEWGFIGGRDSLKEAIAIAKTWIIKGDCWRVVDREGNILFPESKEVEDAI